MVTLIYDTITYIEVSEFKLTSKYLLKGLQMSIRARHTKKTGNRNATRGKTEKLNFLATEHASLLTIALPRGFLVSVVL
jgi:hypothetical protein